LANLKFIISAMKLLLSYYSRLLSLAPFCSWYHKIFV